MAETSDSDIYLAGEGSNRLEDPVVLLTEAFKNNGTKEIDKSLIVDVQTILGDPELMRAARAIVQDPALFGVVTMIEQNPDLLTLMTGESDTKFE